jgi:hypothetical protein
MLWLYLEDKGLATLLHHCKTHKTLHSQQICLSTLNRRTWQICSPKHDQEEHVESQYPLVSCLPSIIKARSSNKQVIARGNTTFYIRVRKRQLPQANEWIAFRKKNDRRKIPFFCRQIFQFLGPNNHLFTQKRRHTGKALSPLKRTHLQSITLPLSFV